jgi:hypothetical protein
MFKKAKMSYGSYSTEFGTKTLKSRDFNAKNAQIFVWDPILEPRLFKKHKSKKKTNNVDTNFDSERWRSQLLYGSLKKPSVLYCIIKM